MNYTFLRHTATYGLYTGLAIVLLNAVDYLLGLYEQNKVLTFLTYAVMIGGIVTGVVLFRKEKPDGYISYGQVVSYSVMTAVFFGLIMAIYSVLLVTVIDPGYLDRMLDMTLEQLYAQGVPEEYIDMAMDMNAKILGPRWTFFSTLLTSVFEGLIIGLIAGIFVKRDRPLLMFTE